MVDKMEFKDVNQLIETIIKMKDKGIIKNRIDSIMYVKKV